MRQAGEPATGRTGGRRIIERPRLIKLLEVEGLPLLRRWHIINLRAKLLSPAAEAFRYFVLENAHDMLDKPPFKYAPGAYRTGNATP